MKILIALIVSVLVLSVLFVRFVHRTFENMIYYPEVLPQDHKFSFSGKFNEITVRDKIGKMAHGLVFEPATSKGVLLYFHGNAGSLDSWGQRARELSNRLSMTVMIWDYPGYGKSDGPLAKETSELIDFAQLFYDKARVDFPQEKIILFGRSFGSGIASELATKNQIEGLILETPYESASRFASEFLWWAPTFLLKIRLKNTQLDQVSLDKVLMLHGTNDEVVPFTHAKSLKEKFPRKLQFVEFENGTHSDLAERDQYWPAITKYVDSVLTGN